MLYNRSLLVIHLKYIDYWLIILYFGLPWYLSWLKKKKVCLQCRRHRFNFWVRKICWRRDKLPTPIFLCFPCGSDGKESACNAGDLGSIPGLGRSPGEGKDYPLQYSGLENCEESDTAERLSLTLNPKDDLRAFTHSFENGFFACLPGARCWGQFTCEEGSPRGDWQGKWSLIFLLFAQVSETAMATVPEPINEVMAYYRSVEKLTPIVLAGLSSQEWIFICASSP